MTKAEFKALFSLLLLAVMAFIGTLLSLPVAKGWTFVLLLGLLPMRTWRDRGHRPPPLRLNREVRQTQAETAADAVTEPCPCCGRMNSVRTRICPRCKRHI